MIIKYKTPLGAKVQTYLRWKHFDKRYVACTAVLPNGMIKALTVSDVDSEDYYYEWVSPLIMHLEIKENNLLTANT